MTSEIDYTVALAEIAQLLQIEPESERKSLDCGLRKHQGFYAGKKIMVVASDPEPRQNSIGVRECEVVLEALSVARIESSPVLFLWSTSGARISEGAVGLQKISKVLQEILLPRNFPVISIVLGSTAGIGSYITTISEFSFMLGGTQLFMTGPKVVAELTGVLETKEQTGGVQVHQKSGIPSVISKDIPELKANLAELLEILLAENSQKEFHYKAYLGNAIDLRLKRISERLCGQIVLSPSLGDPTTLEIRKLNTFLQICSNLQLPLVTHIDTRGMRPGSQEEESGSLGHGAELMRLMASYPAFRIAVIRGGSVAALHLALGAKGVSADYVLATSAADISVMAPIARQAFHDAPGLPLRALIEQGIIDEAIPEEHITLRIEAILREGARTRSSQAK